MARAKISIIGAGNVGASTAWRAAAKELGDLVLVDVVEGLAAGKALDLSQAGPIERYDAKISGSSDYVETAQSDIVIITAGLPRKPGMSRDDLLAKNVAIVREVTEQVAKYSPGAILIVVANPLDAMVYAAHKVSGFDTRRVMGMAGILDISRYRAFIGMELNVSVEDINALLMGGHGDDMVPLPRYTSVAGIPLSELLSAEKIQAIVQRTRDGGAEIVSLLKSGSAYYAPAAAVVQMAEAILKDKKRILPCAAYCDKEYAVGGYFVGTPALLGAQGGEKVLELKLSEPERKLFEASVNHVKELAGQVDKLL